MFTFSWPYMFILLPLFWLAPKLLPRLAEKNEAILRVPFLYRIQALNQNSEAVFLLPHRLKQLMGMLIWTLFIIACANPQWLGTPLPVQQSGRNIMLSIDLSPSMEIPDLQRNNQTINRLETVKSVANGFIEKRHGDKLGLILFGSKAYLQTPLTLDRKTIQSMLNDASIGLAGNRTAIGDAIALGVKKLSTEDVKSRILILLTDGGNNSGTINPVEAAQLAKENHVKIYTVGIGATELLVSSMFGSQLINPSADLDETLLKNIAQTTEGKYFRAQDDTTLINILDAINQLEPIQTEINTMRPITALFYYPLAAAMLLMLVLLFPNIRMKWRA